MAVRERERERDFALVWSVEGVVCESNLGMCLQLPLLWSGWFSLYIISLEIDCGVGIVRNTVLLGSIMHWVA